MQDIKNMQNMLNMLNENLQNSWVADSPAAVQTSQQVSFALDKGDCSWHRLCVQHREQYGPHAKLPADWKDALSKKGWSEDGIAKIGQISPEDIT